MIGYVKVIANAKRLLAANEVEEIKNFLHSKDNFELVMYRRGDICIASDVEYHYGVVGVDYFFFALDNEIRKRGFYNLKTCKFFDAVDAALYEFKVKEYRLEQQRKSELEFLEGLCRYMETH